MHEKNGFERYAQELLELVKGVIQHKDYQDFQQVSEKIIDAIKNGDALKIYDQYPFLTDMFFHVIVAELKCQSDWLDWLWENDISQMNPEDKGKILQHSGDGNMIYHSLRQMISSYIHKNFSRGNSENTIAWQLEGALKNNLQDMRNYLENGADPDDIKTHIVLAKFQLKLLDRGKRKEYLKQYIAVLKDMQTAKKIQAPPKLLRWIRYFIEKYENIPMNFDNEDEYALLGNAYDSKSQFDINYFTKWVSLIGDLHQAHNNQSFVLEKQFSELKKSDSSMLNYCGRRWRAVTNAQGYEKMNSPSKDYAFYIDRGIKAQMLLHRLCARRYYHIDRYGSGEIPVKNLAEKFDCTGQLIEVSYESDGIAMDVFSHIISDRMRNYLDGEHTDSYLIGIIDNVCAWRIDKLTGARITYKAWAANDSLDRPLDNSPEGDKDLTLADTIPAPEKEAPEKDLRDIVLASIKKYSPLLYLYFLLLYYGVTAATLKALKDNHFEAQAEKLVIGQKLNRQAILEIIGKGGNAHFVGRELEKLIRQPEFKKIPELQEAASEIAAFLNKKK